MKKYENVVKTWAIEWQPGVAVPSTHAVEFAATTTPTGTFPAHALVLINGEYKVVLPGQYILYAYQAWYPRQYGLPTGVSTGLLGYKEVSQPESVPQT